MMPETTLPLEPPVLPGPADWPQLVRVALLGTRQAPDALPAPVLPLPAPATGPDQREQQLLLSAGVVALVRKAGFQPEPAPARALGVAPPETLAALGPEGAELLGLMLAGTQASSLSGFLEDMHRHQRRVPHSLLVPLLEAARTRRELHGPAAQVLGQRGLWLAAQHPSWHPVLAAAATAPDASHWETGTTAERVTFLYLLRHANPAQAREHLAAALPQEPAKTQAVLLETLGHHLSAADTDLLEQYLTSKSKEVRQAVRPLLARVPASPLVARLWQRTQSLVQLKKALLSRKLLVELPEQAWDKAWLADGIEQRDGRFAGEKTGLLGQMLALIPPRRWAEHWGLPVPKLLELAAASEWAGLLLTAWAEAALLHHDADWAQALLAWFFAQPRKQIQQLPIGGLAGLLSPAQATDLLLPLLEAAPQFGPEVRWLPLLQLAPGPWPEPLTRRVVAVLAEALSRPERLPRIQYAAGQLLEHLARVVPPGQYALCAPPLELLVQDVPYLQLSLSRLLTALQFGQQLQAALAEPPGPG